MLYINKHVCNIPSYSLDENYSFQNDLLRFTLHLQWSRPTNAIRLGSSLSYNVLSFMNIYKLYLFYGTLCVIYYIRCKIKHDSREVLSTTNYVFTVDTELQLNGVHQKKIMRKKMLSTLWLAIPLHASDYEGKCRN